MSTRTLKGSFCSLAGHSGEIKICDDKAHAFHLLLRETEFMWRGTQPYGSLVEDETKFEIVMWNVGMIECSCLCMFDIWNFSSRLIAEEKRRECRWKNPSDVFPLVTKLDIRRRQSELKWIFPADDSSTIITKQHMKPDVLDALAKLDAAVAVTSRD